MAPAPGPPATPSVGSHHRRRHRRGGAAGVAGLAAQGRVAGIDHGASPGAASGRSHASAGGGRRRDGASACGANGRVHASDGLGADSAGAAGASADLCEARVDASPASAVGGPSAAARFRRAPQRQHRQHHAFSRGAGPRTGRHATAGRHPAMGLRGVASAPCRLSRWRSARRSWLCKNPGASSHASPSATTCSGAAGSGTTTARQCHKQDTIGAAVATWLQTNSRPRSWCASRLAQWRARRWADGRFAHGPGPPGRLRLHAHAPQLRGPPLSPRPHPAGGDAAVPGPAGDPEARGRCQGDRPGGIGNGIGGSLTGILSV
mmetsp:Transcript_19951/g.52568  ORF Transcript_19951/g.52568 Transcript_19951/m.52568 type:complete len:320 (+) Transcript_19951:360-1319(+)